MKEIFFFLIFYFKRGNIFSQVHSLQILLLVYIVSGH